MLNAICPTHARAIHEYCFGTIWDRPHLDLKTRELIVIAAATASDCPNEVALHTRGALNRGATRDEIVETIPQCAPYVGFPKTNHALKAAKDIFDRWEAKRDDWKALWFFGEHELAESWRRRRVCPLTTNPGLPGFGSDAQIGQARLAMGRVRRRHKWGFGVRAASPPLPRKRGREQTEPAARTSQLRCTASTSSSRSSAAALNARMLATRSLLPVSSVIARSAAPAIAMQLWPALSP